MNTRTLAGKRAVVVGGTHGMGYATAQALIARGARVLLTGRSEANVTNAGAELGAAAIAMRSDVSQMTDVDALADRVRATFGEVDAIFHFAGVAGFEPFDAVGEASFDRQFAVNTRGAFFVLQRLAPLVARGGSITAATVTPATASPGMSVYMASKAALRAFAQVLAAELLERDVRVNTLAPGFIDTPTLGLAGMSEAERQAFSAIGDAVTPMKRHGTMAEIANAALFLAFDATFSTGVELVVDGGLSTVDAPV